MFKQDMPTGPFDITDKFGNDRLVFDNNFVGSTSAATRDLKERAEELYRERTLIPSEQRESEGQVRITGEDTFEIEVEIFQPVYDLEAAREIRGQLESVTPGLTLTYVDISTKNVGKATDRNRRFLAKTLWMQLLTRSIFDLSEREIADLEADIRESTEHFGRVDLLNPGDNFFMDLRTKEASMQDLIEFGADAGDVLRNKLDAEIGTVRIAAGNNFNVGI